jgi:hypothetical protein
MDRNSYENRFLFGCGLSILLRLLGFVALWYGLYWVGSRYSYWWSAVILAAWVALFALYTNRQRSKLGGTP